MIRVSIPTDLRTVAQTGSEAFACATPLRLAELVALAVSASLGARAPLDKLERSLRAAYASLLSGECVVDVDGRTYEGLDDVILCAGEATLRFFVNSGARMQRGASPANS